MASPACVPQVNSYNTLKTFQGTNCFSVLRNSYVNSRFESAKAPMLPASYTSQCIFHWANDGLA